MSGVVVGDIYPTNNGGSCEVVAYHGCANVSVKHLDEHGHVSKVSASALRRGNVKNPYHKSYYGVGYLGVGEYAPWVNGSYITAVGVWKSMMERCYSPEYSKKNPTYLDCTAHQDWQNFQTFAEWYYNQDFYDLGYHLDKDILVKGNKVYSSETCCLVPLELNLLISSKRNKANKSLPTGVHYTRTGKKYTSQVSSNGKRKYLGTFSCKYAAHEAYVKEKMMSIRCEALNYRGLVGSDVVEALSKFTLDIETPKNKGDW